MGAGRSNANRESLRCADVLGAFGVTAADVRALGATTKSKSNGAVDEESLPAVLTDLLADTENRTALLRQLICQGDRGLACSARYTHETLAAELTAVFAAIDWTIELTEFETGLHITTIDPTGRRRETTFSYPVTPLAEDNLPAVLSALTTDILDGTDAQFVLLSSGADRWRAALIDRDDFDRLQEGYGERISVLESPLLPPYDLAAYVPDDTAAHSALGLRSTMDGPWPLWARERAEQQANTPEDTDEDTGTKPVDGEPTDVGSFIQEAEPDWSSDDGHTASAADADGFEFSGSPTTSRVSETNNASDADDVASAGFDVDSASNISRAADSEQESNADTEWTAETDETGKERDADDTSSTGFDFGGSSNISRVSESEGPEADTETSETTNTDNTPSTSGSDGFEFGGTPDTLRISSEADDETERTPTTSGSDGFDFGDGSSTQPSGTKTAGGSEPNSEWDPGTPTETDTDSTSSTSEIDDLDFGGSPDTLRLSSDTDDEDETDSTPSATEAETDAPEFGGSASMSRVSETNSEWTTDTDTAWMSETDGEQAAGTDSEQPAETNVSSDPNSEWDPETTADTDSTSATSEGFEFGGTPDTWRVPETENETDTDSTDIHDETDIHDTTTSTSSSAEDDGFGLSGSPGTSRVSETDSDRSASWADDEPDASTESDSETDDDRTDGWSLSGTTKTERVSNDSFGSDVESQSEDDRYRALGAALTTGQDVSVTGLLEDDEFLPELPAAEPEETRITFEDSFDPDAFDDSAAAEESGFVWVDSGSLETERVSNESE